MGLRLTCKITEPGSIPAMSAIDPGLTAVTTPYFSFKLYYTSRGYGCGIYSELILCREQDAKTGA